MYSGISYKYSHMVYMATIYSLFVTCAHVFLLFWALLLDTVQISIMQTGV